MASQPDTHTKEHAHSSETASGSAAVKKIRELTGNALSHEEARRLLAECDGDLNVATNRIADGLESWSEVKEHKPKKEKGPKTGKKEDGGRGRGRGGRGGRGGHRPEGGAPAANGSPQPERAGRGGRGGRGGSERGGATQRPAAPTAALAAAPAIAPKQPAHAPAPQIARVIPPPQHYPGLTAAQIVAGAHLQQQQAAAHAATQPQQPVVQSHPTPAATAAAAHHAPAKPVHPAHTEEAHAAPAHVAPSHAPVAAPQHIVAAPVSQAPAVAQTAVAAATPAPAKTEAANGNSAAANGRRQPNGKKEGDRVARPPRNEAHAQAVTPPGAAAKPVFVLPSSVSGHSADIQFGSFGMTPLGENLPAVHQAKPVVHARAPQAAVQAPGAHSHAQHAQHQAQHVTETSAQSVRPESGYTHEAHAAEQPLEDAGVPQLPPGYAMYPPFMVAPFAYDGEAGRMHPYYDPNAAFGGAPYRGAAGSPDSKLSPQQHLLEGGAQASSATGAGNAQANPQHVGYGGSYGGFGYYPPYMAGPAHGQFYPGQYTNARAYKPGAYGYPGPQTYGTPEGGEESYGKYAPHGAYNPPTTAQAKQSQSQFASPPAAPLDAYNKTQDYASKGYGNRESAAAAQYAYQGYPPYYPMHMAQYGGQPQGQSSQPAGRTNQ